MSGLGMWHRISMLLLLAGCQVSTSEPVAAMDDQEENMVSASASDVLSPSELQKQEALARKGEQPAIAKVEWHYMRTGDTEKFRYWLEHGAATGHPASMQRLATHLAQEGGPDNCKRAIKLLEDARSKITDPVELKQSPIDTDLQVLRGEIDGVPPCK